MSEESYRRQLEAICNNASVALFIMDEHQHCVYMNPAAVALTGYSFEEVRGRPLHDVVHHTRPDGSPYPLEECPIDRAFPQNNQERGEEVFVHKDGHFYHVAFTASPIRDGGDIVGTVVEVQDVTERKQAEAALRRAADAQAYRVALTDALRFLADPDRIKAEAARVLGEHLGAARVHHTQIGADGEYGRIEEQYLADGVPSAAGKHLIADYAPGVIAELWAGRTVVVGDLSADPRLSAAQRQRTVALGVHAYVAVPLLRRGRLVTLFSVHVAAPRQWTVEEIGLIEETAERTWVAVERVHAERKRREAEAELRESAARLQFALEAAQIGDWDLDLRDYTARCSLRHDQCFGYQEPVSDWGLEAFVQHVHPEDRAWVEQAFRAAIDSLRDWRVECRVVWPDGSVHWIAAHGSIYNVDGQPNRMLGIVFDITERKRVEQELKEANARLIDNDRRKDEFLAMLAHELRNPLAAACNAVRLLESAASGEQRTTGSLAILRRQTDTLAGLVDDLLDVSRVSRGAIELKTERLDLGRAVDSAVAAVAPLMAEKGHRVDVRVVPEPLFIMGDPVRIEQILVNLLTNAAKYTDPGGRIEVSLERRAEWAELRVRDDGIGLAADVLERVFTLFGQAERGLDRSQGGLGIGLTIVKNLVELHGGLIEARSEGLGRGAEFRVLLPRKTAAAPEVAQAASDASDAVPARRILVVDDSADIADSLALLLESAGHQVAVAYDGAESLVKAEQWRPDLILLDIGLPETDGYEVARRLRRNPATRGIVLAALTGYGQPADRERALAAGFDRHFVKPVDIDVLEAFVADPGRARDSTEEP